MIDAQAAYRKLATPAATPLSVPEMVALLKVVSIERTYNGPNEWELYRQVVQALEKVSQ